MQNFANFENFRSSNPTVTCFFDSINVKVNFAKKTRVNISIYDNILYFSLGSETIEMAVDLENFIKNLRNIQLNSRAAVVSGIWEFIELLWVMMWKSHLQIRLVGMWCIRLDFSMVKSSTFKQDWWAKQRMLNLRGSQYWYFYWSRISHK